MSTARAREIADAVAAQRDRLRSACSAAGRAEREVALLPVTKFFPASDVQILYRLGFRDFGESRVQEAAAKVEEFAELEPEADVRWHMIGQLQRKKANAVARWASSVQSVDSSKLVSALERAVQSARQRGDRVSDLSVYLQVSLDQDEERGGAPPDELDALGAQVDGAEGLRLAGLMSVPPLGAVPEEAFAELSDIHTRFMARFPSAVELSAGMSGDAEIAVRHGSTCVRVGTALLGLRTITSP
ncbi:YggS family pyridoxal phosphate-dependent enzyme [Hoyosella subflava]|uniref:YggS family pyridoxal phosphate-dependent enzyme n=1 Tax=Hoyosella subflava TaxID=639313 RepID=UPI00059D10D6|nr:YggS family pyridoxal phosphate-dependent enzyme [Hoyosella subflava]